MTDIPAHYEDSFIWHCLPKAPLYHTRWDKNSASTGLVAPLGFENHGRWHGAFTFSSRLVER